MSAGFAIDPAEVRAWKRYPAYKDSGVEWIGEVPAGWEIQKLKFFARIRLSSVDKKSEENEKGVMLCNYTDVYYNDWITKDLEFMKATASPEEIASFTLRKGDVLITKDSEDWKDIAVPAHVDEDLDGVLCGYHLAQIRLDQKAVDSKYLFWSFKAHGVNHQFQIASNGITRYGLGKYWIDNSSFLVPPLPEQHAIAAFLDRETARLDALIAKKQRFIELLEEKRQAVISHAVTKGLDPDAEMKDSGIEWLGEVPAGWEVIRNRVLIDSVEQGWSPVAEDRLAEDDEWAVIKLNAISRGRFYPLEHKVLSVDYDGKDIWKINPGDLLITRSNTRELVGNVCLVDSTGNKKLILSDLVYKLNYCKRSVNPSFIKYWMLSRTGRYQIERDARGSSSSMVKISQELIKFWFVVVPQLPEQRAIAAFLDRETARIDAVIDTINQQIEKLHEYRTALISAVVTGKIDVRGEEAV